MSPRAACRLEALGFTQVYDYVAGKADWLARGMPTEGDKAAAARVASLLRDDFARARMDEPVGDVRGRVEASPYGFALVVSADGTLLGRLRRTVLESDASTPAGELMEPGPSTVRLDTDVAKLARRLDRRELKTAVVTDPDGKLAGVVRRADLPRAEGEP